MFMVVDGRRRQYGGCGYDLIQLAKICKAMGAKYALNLDGGGSTGMYYKVRGETSANIVKTVGHNGRTVGNAIVVTGNKDAAMPADEYPLVKT